MPFSARNLLDLGLCALLLTLAYVYYRVRSGPAERVADRVRMLNALKITTTSEIEETDDTLTKRLLRRIADLGERLPLLDAKRRAALTRTLVRAGFRSRRATALLVATKFFAGLAFAIPAFIVFADVPNFGEYFIMRAFAFLGGFMIGMIVPEYALAWYSRRRRNEISLYLPDALDLLVICTNAGNSLSVAIRRVSSEIALMAPALAQELTFTANELQLGGDSTAVLRNFAERVDLPSARSLVSTLIQSMQYGTPITQALRVLSRSERAARLMAMEEKAAKLPPKITLPMMIFILPTVVMIACGPAILTLGSVFKDLLK
ncbi:type II secretion system F family protein [Paraburkholderia sp. PREW-6R]|uniref:type II secretion system F family protein n=1 Tax=Paraburkholderia sp. PREW-6R TaxID=3141544 RepID=UPI0031F52192